MRANIALALSRHCWRPSSPLLGKCFGMYCTICVLEGTLLGCSVTVTTKAAGCDVIVIMEIITWNVWQDRQTAKEWLAGKLHWNFVSIYLCCQLL